MRTISFFFRTKIHTVRFYWTNRNEFSDIIRRHWMNALCAYNRLKFYLDFINQIHRSTFHSHASFMKYPIHSNNGGWWHFTSCKMMSSLVKPEKNIPNAIITSIYPFTTRYLNEANIHNLFRYVNFWIGC